MSRRGATTLAKDPTEAPPGSVLGQILLDTGSLAGDFISQDLLARLKGEIVGNYFHQFIANHSAVVTHLHKMIEPKAKKSTKLAWSPEGLVAFESLRDLIANSPLLHFPDDTSPITLRTDASDFGVGGVLFQTIDGIENPIASH
jgi:RNase H-like domain found in reverse transcriptase